MKGWNSSGAGGPSLNAHSKRIARELWTVGRSVSPYGEPLRRLETQSSSRWLVAESRPTVDAFDEPRGPFLFSLHPALKFEPEFRKGLPLLRAYGPAKDVPGGVGVVSGQHGQTLDGAPFLTIRIMQGLYRSARDKTLTNAQRKIALPGRLADLYGGWLEHLLETVFSYAERHGVRALSFSPDGVTRRSLEHKASVVRTVAKRWGFLIESTEHSNVFSIHAFKPA